MNRKAFFLLLIVLLFSGCADPSKFRCPRCRDTGRTKKFSHFMVTFIAEVWKTDQNDLTESSEQITALFSEKQESTPHSLSRTAVEKAENRFEESYDTQWGGFGHAPKFPAPHNLMFLLRCHQLGVGQNALAMTEQTLQSIYRGGIFDHVGGGFSRYATDERWLVPHFEKMLYDNALLAIAYIEAFQITGNPLYRGITKKILRYVGHEMTSPEGGFYSAQDADCEGKEGKFYMFTPNEIRRVLGDADGIVFCRRYDVTESGDFEGKNIPNLLHREAVLPDAEMEIFLEKLYLYRKKRYPLHRDDKSLTAWNALMIAAYAKADRVLEEPAYLHAAEKAYEFIMRHLTATDGSLLVSFRNGQSKGQGLLDDYAFLAWACLELYESTFRLAYLEQACRLMNRVLDEFADSSGGFYLTSKSGNPLLFRPKEYYDGAMPSGNSVAAMCLVHLGALTGEEKWQKATERHLAGFGEWFENRPEGVAFALMALLPMVFPAQELVCVLADEKEKKPLAHKLGSFAHPQTTVLVKTASDQEEMARIAPFTADYPIPEQKAAYYLCQNHRCDPPVDSFDSIRRKLLAENRR